MFKSFWLYCYFGILFFGELVLMAASEEVNLNDSKVCFSFPSENLLSLFILWSFSFKVLLKDLKLLMGLLSVYGFDQCFGFWELKFSLILSRPLGGNDAYVDFLYWFVVVIVPLYMVIWVLGLCSWWGNILPFFLKIWDCFVFGFHFLS